MYKLLEFIRRIYVVLLFVVIEAIALYCYALSSYYTQAKILAHANSVMGGIQGTIYNVRHYFTLRSENQLLAERVAHLESELEYYREQGATEREDKAARAAIDSALMGHLVQYRYLTAQVIANTMNRRNNFITLNRGLIHGVQPNMGVITPDGNMVGYVATCSNRYSVVVPLLNEDFHTSGKVGGEVGAIRWVGRDPYKVKMSELSKYADVKVGDEVLGSGVSHYFPSDFNVRIGYVESVQPNPNHTSYDVEVRLATEFSRLDNVILIENGDFNEIINLEQSVENGTYMQEYSDY